MDNDIVLIQKKNYRIYLISGLIISLASGIFGPFYILFIQQKGGGIENFGIAMGFLMLTQSIIAYFAGRYSDTLGRKPLLILEGYATFVVILAYLFISQVWQLYLLQIASGLTTGIYETVRNSFLADITEKRTRGKMIGKYNALIGIAAAITMMFSGYLVVLTRIEIVFIIMAIAEIISASLLFLIKER